MNAKNVVPTATPESEFAQGPTNPPHRILVVEDDEVIRLFNAEALERLGYKVDTAEDGESGWRTLYAVSYDPDGYDLLITDNDMPKVTGVELLRRLRAARMEMPVIMATGALPEPEPSHSPWLQPAATLLKPYTTDELLGTVREVLRAVDSSSCESNAPPPDWRTQPSADEWQM